MITGSAATGAVPKRRRVPVWLRRGGVALITALILEYLVVPQLAGARSALTTLSQVTPGFLAIGLALEVASLVSYSALTRALLPAVDRPPLWTVLRIDLSALGLSHVVPGGGATASALRYRFLTLTGAPGGDVLSAIAIEATAAAAALALAFAAGLVMAFSTVRHNPYLVWAGAITAVPLVAGVWAAWLLIRHETATVAGLRAGCARLATHLPMIHPDGVVRLVQSLADRLRALSGDRRLMISVSGWATANWVFDAASLWVFLRAFGATEGLQELILGYALAGLLALLPLTPGGLGIVEGTLVSVLVGFGTSHQPAVIGVISWRLAEFWMPIPLAALAYLSLRTGTLRRHQLPARPLIPRTEPTS